MKRKEVFKIICVMLVTVFIITPVVAGQYQKNLSVIENEERTNDENSGAEFKIKKIGVTLGGWWIYLDTYFYCIVENTGDEAARTYIQTYLGPLFPPGIVNHRNTFTTEIIEPGETAKVKMHKIENLNGGGGFYYLKCVADPYDSLGKGPDTNVRIFCIESTYAIPLIYVPTLG